ncbi:MAG: hypothetical protein CSH36_00330 [Thalassolituus sp.]|nr:MAG: hypothetical protein CSH36_00330 [Thalassolituus sp.]
MKKNLTTLALVIAAGNAQAGLPEGYSIALEFDQNIEDVAPEMLDWWWNNIRTEERFIDWNPEHHVGYELVVPPADAATLELATGTVQNLTEYLGGFTIDTQVTWAEPFNTAAGDYQLVAEIRFRGLEDLSVPGNGWLVYDYAPDESLTGTDVHATLLLPDVVAVAFPGIRDTVTEHLRTDLNNMTDFLPDMFQEEFIEEELESRGTYRVEKNGFWLRTVIVDQEIKGLTPDMMNWWWDNIDSTYRYQRWHPTAHLSFEWLEAPSSPDNTTYSVGAVQRVVEYLGPYKNALLITWLPKEDAAERVEYNHWLYAKTDLDGLSGIMPQDMIHEYQMNAIGDGIVMRSTFNVPFFLNWVMPGFTDELGKHALQEMQMLQYFLPALFAEQELD